MKKPTAQRIALATLAGLLFPWLSPLAHAQEPRKQQRSAQQVNVSDKELKAFAKAYVEYQKIRQAYEPSLEKAKDAREREKIQREANVKIKAALGKQGLDVNSYNRIFTAVNANEELRKKTLRLIDEERKKAAM